MALVTALALGATLGACGGGGDGDAPDDGARDQAVERLVGFGLEPDQAECLVEELGADAVVETAELTVLTEGGDYRAAAEECIDGS